MITVEGVKLMTLILKLLILIERIESKSLNGRQTEGRKQIKFP